MQDPPTMEEAVRGLFRLLERNSYARPQTMRGGTPAAQKAAIEASAEAWAATAKSAGLTDPEDFLAAGVAWMASDTGGFWPKAGMVIGVHLKLAGVAQLNGDGAWGHFLTLVHRHGVRAIPCYTAEDHAAAIARWTAQGNTPTCYTSPRPFLVHEDPLVARGLQTAIESIGGWRSVSRLTADSNTADRASFRTAYNAELERRVLVNQAARIDDRTAKLIGWKR